MIPYAVRRHDLGFFEIKRFMVHPVINRFMSCVFPEETRFHIFMISTTHILELNEL